MKKLLILIAALVFPVFAFAGGSDIVLTPEGTLYRVETVDVRGMEGMPTGASWALRVTSHTPTEASTMFVPGTLDGATHYNASLAYDEASDSLFVFWVKMPNMMSTELLFASYHGGFWTEPVSIDNAVFHYRTDLRIGVTHWAWETAEDGTRTKVPALGVHAIWWDESGYGEAARYAVITLQDGGVSGIELHDLSEFVDPSAAPAESVVLDPDFNRDIFRHPSIAVRPGSDGVDIVFGDIVTGYFHSIELEPAHLQGVITVPIGFAPGETIGAPSHFAAATTDLETLRGDEPGQLMFYFRDDAGNIQFIMHRNGVWTDLRTLALDETISYDAAVNALGRMIKGN